MLNFARVNIIFAIILLLFLYFIPSAYFYLLFPILFISWITITTIGSFHIRWNYFLKAIHNNYNVKENFVSLTFDDGPHPEFTLKVLALLKKFNVKATFFLIGKNAEKYPDIVKTIVSEGHAIGNHSYAHTNNYGFLKTKQVVADVVKAQKIIQTITNSTNNYFRPPFGVTNPNISKALKQLDLQVFGWSVRSFDTIAKSVDEVINKITPKIKKGDIILLHDTSELSLIILEQLLQFFKQEKLKSVTLEQLVNKKE